MIKIVNKHWHKPTVNDIYIGRGSVFGNPYSHLPSNFDTIKVKDRLEAVEKYREWFHKERKNNFQMYDQLNKMIGFAGHGIDINLVCYCSPQPCHGSIIKEYLEENLRIRSESLGETKI